MYSLDDEKMGGLQMHDALVRVVEAVDVPKLASASRGESQQVDLAHEFGEHAICLDESFLIRGLGVHDVVSFNASGMPPVLRRRAPLLCGSPGASRYFRRAASA
ncbi:hypothetical protein [Nocardia sputorum]|uniref:hypothetical protein n=1 Tax=Nocardia sputorum TaxID=2984338 RepID=UPI00249122EA|nr:hypothetical protein [Nocardia sputorum]